MPIKKDPGKKQKDSYDDNIEIPAPYIEQFGEEFAKELFDKDKLNEPIKEAKVNIIIYVKILFLTICIFRINGSFYLHF